MVELFTVNWRHELDHIAKRHNYIPIYTGQNALRSRHGNRPELVYDYVWTRYQILAHQNAFALRDVFLIAEFEDHIVERQELFWEFNKLLIGKAPVKLFAFKLGNPRHGRTLTRWAEILCLFQNAITSYANSKVGETYIFINRGISPNRAAFVVVEDEEKQLRLHKMNICSMHDWRYFKLLIDLDFYHLNELLLRRYGLRFIGDLVQKTEGELLSILADIGLRRPDIQRLANPTFHQRCLGEIKSVLAEWGLRLETEIPGWPPLDLLQKYPQWNG